VIPFPGHWYERRDPVAWRAAPRTSYMNNRRAGFTLIELLIVCTIIGILAAIALPKFKNTKAKAYVASIKSDLRNIATAEESYFYENATYTDDPANLKYNNSGGVKVVEMRADAAGWSAKLTHPQAWPLECAIYFGTPPGGKIPPAESEGILACQ